MSHRGQSVSVVVCAYTEERWNDLVAAVESLEQQIRASREIIVVVDHNPQLLERVRAHIPSVVAVPNHELRGLSGARNSGIAVAQGDVIAFLDEDASAAPDWLLRLLEHYDNPQTLGVGGAIEPVWQHGRPRWFPPEFDWVVGCTYQGMPQTTTPVRNLIGCNMSFRRSVFETVGGFRNGIGRVGNRPVGCEETELCIRVRQRWPHTTLLYAPHARVYHRVPATRGRWHYFRARCYAEGLSKAMVARFVGAHDGLASERAYTLRTLPRGVVQGLQDTVVRGHAADVARAGAIVVGLLFTTSGYLKGRLSKLPDELPVSHASALLQQDGQ